MSKKKESNIGPRDYKISEIKRLFALSKNQCSEPSCINHLIGEDGHTVIGKICHIEAAKEGGPRFRETMNDEERRSYDNLILLCDEHHQIIDNKTNENEFSVTLLQNWKVKHLSSELKTKQQYSDDIIANFIDASKQYYSKIDSLDGPYKPKISNSYIKREFENDFLATLKEKKCLLLTGISFCGKSEMAKNLALNFFDDGYLYKRVLTTRDAASFLESIGTNRICFLEDPFGHKIEDKNSNELKRLQDLLNNIPENQLLVVTSRKEIVLSIFSESGLSKCNIENHEWFDITSTDSSFLRNIWSKISQQNNLKQENTKEVNELLLTNKLLQPGQLTYLAKLPELKTKAYSKDKLFELAQINAREIRESILSIDNYTWKVFLIMGLSCDTINGCSYKDLEYIFDSNIKTLSLEPEREKYESFFGKDEKDFIFPQYINNENRIDAFENGIDSLEMRGYIVYDNNKYVFAHPQYREISKGFMLGLSIIKQRQILPFICNVISCLNSEISFNISNNIGFIVENFDHTYKSQFTDFVFKTSENSYFPKVIDQCYLHLLQNFRSNEVEQYQRDLLNRLQSSDDNYGISFIESQPIKWRGSDSLSRLFTTPDLPYTTLVENIKKGIPITSENVWTTLLAVNRIGEKFNIEFLEYCFKSSEVFIRNLAAYNYFLNVNSFQGSFLTDKILIDEQPSVLFFALKGFLQGIPNNGKYLNKELKERFLYFFNNDEIFCIRSSNLLTNFATDYATESIEWKDINYNRKSWVWRIWADLFIAFMKTFPKNVRFSNAPRFSSMMNEAKVFVYPEQAVKITKGLLNYIEANLKTRVPDNFEMHLIDFLIDATESKPEIRFSIFKKMISGNYTTTYNGYNLSWAISRWDILQSNEKQVIFSLLKSNRKDLDWLKAILINYYENPPKEIQELIFKKEDYLSQSLDEIVNGNFKELLQKAIKVYAGIDGALQEIGTSHTSPLVKKLTIHIAKNNYQIEYETCVLEFLSDILNGVREEEWEQIKIDWLEIFNNCTDNDSLIKLILTQVSKTSFIKESTSYVFKVMIDYYFETKRIDYLANIIAEKIEELTYTSGDRDVLHILNYKGFLYDHVFQLLPRNNLLLNLVYGIKEKKLNKHEIDKYLKLVMKETDEPIHFRLIFDLIKQIKEMELVDSDILKQLQSIPNDITHRHKEYFNTDVPIKKEKDIIYFLD
ncbi:MAG: hypothetical protein ACSHXA_09455 [Polaribacter sp.]|uniref:nSTAND3 domain-containing NTPase n=1 Tax=Polaribacter sp. TaxID=1920175 RepID=UPI003EF578F1